MTSQHSFRDEFLEDGFTHLPKALDAESVQLALRCWQWSIDHPGPTSALVLPDSLVFTDDLSTARASSGSSDDGFFYQDNSNPASKRIYEPLLANPAITALLTSLFHGGPAWFIGEQVFLKEGNSPATGWHQDASDFSARGDELVVLWITFDSVDEETSLGLVRGSHRGSVYSSIYGRYEADPIPDLDAHPDKFEVVSFACEPGDVVAFHMGCLHGRGRTRPGQHRHTLALRFIGEETFFESRSDPRDPRNGKPFGRRKLRQVLPAGTHSGNLSLDE